MPATLSASTRFESLQGSRLSLVLTGVVLLHVGVGLALWAMPPMPVRPIEPPKPIAIRWVAPAPQPTPAPTPTPKKTEPVKPKVVPVLNKVPTATVTPKPVIVPRQTVLATPAAVTPTHTVAVAAEPAPVAAVPAPTESAPPPAPAASAQPSPPAPPKTVQGVAYRHQPELVYPESARDRGEQGRVLVLVLIDTEGRVQEAKIQRSSGSKLLDQAALKMAKKTTFHPYRENGVAQPVYVPMPLEFKLDEE